MKKLNISIREKCPCQQSDKPLADCCLYEGRFLRKKVPNLSPPGPQTGFSQNGCYLSHTKNCSEDLSAEHYISRSVLEEIGNEITIEGVPWLQKGEAKTLGANSITARILCRRHNEALSPLDAEAGHFFKRIKDSFIDTTKSSSSEKIEFILFSGEIIELWMLKAACGLYYSKNAANEGRILLKEAKIDEALVRQAFYQNKWINSACGLYIKASIGHSFQIKHAVSMTPLMTKDGSFLIGAKLALWGIEFFILFDPKGIHLPQIQSDGLIQRPTELVFPVQQRRSSIALTWLPGQKEKSITFGSEEP